MPYLLTVQFPIVGCQAKCRKRLKKRSQLTCACNTQSVLKYRFISAIDDNALSFLHMDDKATQKTQKYLQFICSITF